MTDRELFDALEDFLDRHSEGPSDDAPANQAMKLLVQLRSWRARPMAEIWDR